MQTKNVADETPLHTTGRLFRSREFFSTLMFSLVDLR